MLNRPGTSTSMDARTLGFTASPIDRLRFRVLFIGRYPDKLRISTSVTISVMGSLGEASKPSAR
jgi:hypothetical protein